MEQRNESIQREFSNTKDLLFQEIKQLKKENQRILQELEQEKASANLQREELNSKIRALRKDAKEHMTEELRETLQELKKKGESQVESPEKNQRKIKELIEDYDSETPKIIYDDEFAQKLQ